MILFHLADCSGLAVADDLLVELVNIQTEVREYFGWEYQEDVKSAAAMSKFFTSENPFGVGDWSPKNRDLQLETLAVKLRDAQQVVIVGASVSDDDFLDFDFENSVIIAADGSVGGVVGMGNVACVVTDFDGNPHLDKVAQNNMLFVAHAHGDNQKRWKSSLQEWSGYPRPPRLILTHQVTELLPGMHNFGGFTDGDRAVCLAIALGVDIDKITLIGFSTIKIGKWSGQTDPVKKLEKLDWMLNVLRLLGLDNQVTTNVSSKP